jgi:hypothetical protein
MVLLTNPLKRFALAGALLFGCLPGVAQAKWIKATVTGTTVLTNAQQPPNVGTDIGPLTFVFQNYAGGTPSTPGGTNEWVQKTVRPNYTQLFGYGTGGTTGLLQGNYDASSTPYNSAGMGNFFSSNTNGTNFNLRVGSQGSSSGLTVATGNPSVTRNVEFISLENGSVNLVNTAPTSNDVVDFLKASLGTRTCTIAEGTCLGKIQAADEGLITFSWSTIEFEEIEAVPAPLPIAGALAGFRLSRKIRSRIKAN